MPITTIIILAAIVAVFALFGVVLAWGEMQTRNLDRDQQHARKTAQAADFGKSYPGQVSGCRREKYEPPTRGSSGLIGSPVTQNLGADAPGFFVSKGLATVAKAQAGTTGTLSLRSLAMNCGSLCRCAVTSSGGVSASHWSNDTSA